VSDYETAFEHGELPEWSAAHEHRWVALPECDWMVCTVCEQQIPAFVVVER
jgi:hypothetical protein